MALRAMACAALLAVAGCAVSTGGPQDVEVVRAGARPGVALPPAGGEAVLLVRAVPAGMTGQEVRGAACVAESPYFVAEFSSPARLLLPDYGAAAPSVTVACRTPTASGSAVASPRPGGFYGWPAVGISVGTGDIDGVGVGVGWYGGGVGAPVGARYGTLRVPLE